MKISSPKLLSALLTCLSLSACNDMGSSADAPPDVAVLPGDGMVTVTWTQKPSVEYWLMYAKANSITVHNWSDLGGKAIIAANSPQIVNNLVNGSTYSFTMDARVDNGPGGSGSPSISATPRLAGASWLNNTALAHELRGLAFGDKFVAVGANGALYSSPDMNAVTTLNWSAKTNPIVFPPSLNAVTYAASTYLAVGDNGSILRSTDANTWTQQTSNTTKHLYAVAGNATGSYVAVGQGGTIISSSGGSTWSAPITVAAGNDLHAIYYFNGTWIAAGQNGSLLTSTDTLNWTSRTSNTTRTLRSIAYGAIANTSNALLLAVGDAGALVTSSDVSTWTAQTAITTGNLRAVSYGTQFVAVGDTGGVFTSTNGTTWTAQSSGSTQQLNAIARGNYGYVGVGASGTNLSAW